ncbi:MAG: SMC-Scp complex subunit ScpB [Pseudomonadota bacterium]|jgi:segregation and condensation protein B
MLNVFLLKKMVEAALLAAGKPLSIQELADLWINTNEVSATNVQQLKIDIMTVLHEIAQTCIEERGVELKEVASGFRFQVKLEVAPQVSKLWTERPTRYSRALLETLVLIAYRQPITRSEIEQVRGVSVNVQIMKTLLDFEWIKIVGQRNTAGRPRLYGTTAAFLDHFGLKNLEDLPSLEKLKENALALREKDHEQF